MAQKVLSAPCVVRSRVVFSQPKSGLLSECRLATCEPHHHQRERGGYSLLPLARALFHVFSSLFHRFSWQVPRSNESHVQERKTSFPFFLMTFSLTTLGSYNVVMSVRSTCFVWGHRRKCCWWGKKKGCGTLLIGHVARTSELAPASACFLLVSALQHNPPVRLCVLWAAASNCVEKLCDTLPRFCACLENVIWWHAKGSSEHRHIILGERPCTRPRIDQVNCWERVASASYVGCGVVD